MKLGAYYNETYALRYLSLSPSTVQGYESSYHLHVEPQWADWEMHEIRVRHINTWLATAFIDNPGGADKAYKVLRQILRSAMADECYPDDVVDPTTRGVRLPRKPWRGEPQHLTPKEVKKLLLGVQGWEYEPVVVCGVWMGLRRCEACGLQWGDFDLKLGTLKINRTVCRISCENGHTKVVIQTPKTRTSRREIPIPKQLLIMLKKLRGCVSNATWFLSGNESKPTEPRCYRKSIKAYLKQATVRQIRPHALRHTFATTCLQAGCDVKTLSELLGHANANITLQRYVHSDLTRKRREMNRIFSHQVSMRGRSALNIT